MWKRSRTARVPGLRIIFKDEGPGIADIDAGSEGRIYLRSRHGSGPGGAKRLSNEFEIDSEAGPKVRESPFCDGKDCKRWRHSYLASKIRARSRKPAETRGGWRWNCGFRRAGRRKGRHRGDRSVHQPAETCGYGRNHAASSRPSANRHSRLRRLLEILVLDSGPGIAQCGRDACGTGTAPPALPARDWAPSAVFRRIPKLFAAGARHGAPGAQFAGSEECRCSDRHDTGAVQVPKPGEEVCGDQWGVTGRTDAARFCWPTGLGHGTDAAMRLHGRRRMLYKHPDLSVTELLARVHDALRSYPRRRGSDRRNRRRARHGHFRRTRKYFSGTYLPTTLRRGTWSRPTARPA